jgi:hypothetical protein
VREFAVDDLLANLRDAFRAEGVGGAGPAEGRLLFLVALEKGLVTPLGGEALIGADQVQSAEDCPTCFGSIGERLFEQFSLRH